MRTGRTPRSAHPALAALAVVSLSLAACGDDGGDAVSAESDAPATDAPAETAPPDDGGAGPSRIVSLSPTHTEMMFAIGAGDLLVAVDDQSDHPAEVLDLPRDLSGFEPNVEAIAGYEPDLVVMGGDFTGLGEQLDALGIEWWDGPAAQTLDDTYAQIEQLGEVTGHGTNADELVASMQREIDEIVASTPDPAAPLAVYHELDPSYYSVDSTTFIGTLYAMLGLENIADQADGDAGGYPQLNAEFIVSADPDLVFLADTECCGESAETVAARPGWDAIAAVQNGGVVEMSDDIASRWGPRVVDYLAAVSRAVQTAGDSA